MAHLLLSWRKKMQAFYPQRIICLTEETTETLYLLGEQDRIVGISGFVVRPPQARKEKPRVSLFTSANIDAILQLEPDLVLGFSDIQADIAAQLIKAGVSVYIFNHRSISGIYSMILQLGGMIGVPEKAQTLVNSLQQKIQNVEKQARSLPRKPRVYFEEWYDPIITGIQWVSELIRIAGGEDCFPELSQEPLARNRIIADANVIIQRQPDIIIGSWCGKKFKSQQVMERPGWDRIPAVRQGHIYEIPSSIILQPGPAAITDGLDALHQIIAQWAQQSA